ncbi:putative FAD-linked oxidoreductase YvdP [Actinomadura rubteroloni]|uniref:Putative FAD-linked oxidoreductase YvdP n=1 Tax=Actinomadura rubteroloni TaxID=1926885 RepID=A0A2P4UCS2_9ACTN|nr:FAD-binding protein [Actinomadura rubteroloni]POM22837.1 putative FAD-linked oxidoreductase YvdP [Actinomadura rubteroloni]
MFNLAGAPVAAAGAERASLVTVGAGDRRYADLTLRRRNERFDHRPERFHLPSSAEQVAAAVTGAVADGLHITVRSGGHSLENSVGERPGGTILDMSAMNAVYWDPEMRAFAVESGAQLGDIFRTLYLGWGVTIPGGWCHSVCAGGHIQGGGYGALSRSLGSVVDHLHAVEVVVVGRDGVARAVRATRDPGDPNHDLWWAHTGGGGGNFGVVTRYWLRSPGGDGSDPAASLPKPPTALIGGALMWSWKDLTREDFQRLMSNHGRWHEDNSAPGQRTNALHSTLMITGRQAVDGPADLLLFAQVDGGRPDAPAMLENYFDAVDAGVGGVRQVGAKTPWMHAVIPHSPDTDSQRGAEYARYKGKAGYLRRSFSDRQVDTIYDYLIERRPSIELARLWLVSYGGMVNAVGPSATALAQRDSIIKAVYTATWQDADADAENLDWLRRLYRDVYADTGGVPVPGAANDGSYINYPDVDLTDPAWNASGVPWHDLYYKENYPRLQRIKADWDPLHVFQHTLSIRPASDRSEQR